MGIKKPQLVKVEAFNIFYIGGFATPSLPRGRVFLIGGGMEGFQGALAAGLPLGSGDSCRLSDCCFYWLIGGWGD